jgi:ABC-type glycerol-3-phosphate transport system substrate-binding protein
MRRPVDTLVCQGYPQAPRIFGVRSRCGFGRAEWWRRVSRQDASNPRSRAGLTRRQFLARSGSFAFSSSALVSLLAACGQAPQQPPAQPPAEPTSAVPDATAGRPTEAGGPLAPFVAQPTGPVELRWVAQKHPALDYAFERLQVWAQQRGNVKLVPAPISYEVLVDRLSEELVLPSPNVDITWHNDDWGQLWGQHLEPLDDIPAIREKTDRRMYEPFWIWSGNITGIPFLETLQTFFIRKDLIAEKDVVEWSWKDMTERLTRLQADGKVKWGYVGGMKYPHTWFTWLWSVWGNNSDLYLPKYERDNTVLKQNGWKSGLTEKGWLETAEFWHDAIHTNKMSPPGLPGFTRTDADAMFMGGEAAMTNNDSPLWSDYNNPQKSKVAEKVGLAGFPVGPSGDQRTAHRAPLGFAIPKNIPPEKKGLAKEAVAWLLTDDETQTQLWKKTGGVPANLDVQKKLKASDELFNKLAAVTIEAPKLVLPAYYFPQWPQAHATLSDALSRYITGEKAAAGQIFEETARALQHLPQI